MKDDLELHEMYENGTYKLYNTAIADRVLLERELYRIAMAYRATLRSYASKAVFRQLFDEHKDEIKGNDPSEFMNGIIDRHKIKMEEMHRASYPLFYYLKDVMGRLMNLNK